MSNMFNITAKKAPYPGNLADEYLELKRQKAELAQQEANLKRAILACESESIEGNWARVTISRTPGKLVPDAKAMEALIEDAGLQVPQKVRAPVVRINVNARSAEAAA